MHSLKNNVAAHSIVQKHSSHYVVEVPVFTMDSVVRKLDLPKVDFIKIDAEGAEIRVLKGATETLLNNSAKVAVAAYHPSNDPQEIASFVASLGYETIHAHVVSKNFIYAWKK